MSIAVEAGLDPDGSVDVHIEDSVEIDEIPHFVRARHDFHAELRTKVKNRVVHGLRTLTSLREFADADRYGDVTIVAALSTDTIKSVLESAESGQPITIATLNSEDRVECAGAVKGENVHSGPSLSDLDLSNDSTIADLLSALNSRCATHAHALVHA